MERPFICKCLTAEYEEEKSVLRGPVHIQFDIGKEQLFHVDIEQAVIRSIKISTDSDVSIFDLNTVLSKIERLLMLLDGRFIQLKEIFKRLIDSMCSKFDCTKIKLFLLS